MADQLSDEMKAFRIQHLSVLDAVDFYKLVSIAKEATYEEGDVMMIQGQRNPHVHLVIEGELEVLRDGTLTYVLQRGNFVSESGLHAGLLLSGSMEACGSIVVGHPFDPSSTIYKRNRVRVLTWDRTELVQLLETDRGLRNSLKAALSWDIVRKLKTQRHMLVEGRVKDATALTKKREDQGISRYAAILQNILRLPPDEIQAMSQELNKYRLIHHIEDVDHERALAKCGWTKEEFRLGRQEKKDWEEDDDNMEEEFESIRWRKVKRFASRVGRTLLQ
jgi:CRP-like cAMP-binding protein